MKSSFTHNERVFKFEFEHDRPVRCYRYLAGCSLSALTRSTLNMMLDGHLIPRAE